MQSEVSRAVVERHAETGKKIAELRKTAGLTQRQLALKAGVDRSGLAQIERGARKANEATLQQIATALGVTPTLLAGEIPAAVVGDRTVMTTEEVGELLQIPVGTLRQWRHHNTGPRSFKLGSLVRYHRKDVETWLTEQYEATAR